MCFVCEKKREKKTGRKGQFEEIEIIVTIQEGNEDPLFILIFSRTICQYASQ
jgi:superfamily II RNA helicase